MSTEKAADQKEATTSKETGAQTAAKAADQNEAATSKETGAQTAATADKKTPSETGKTKKEGSKTAKKGKVKVRILAVNMAGKYLLPYNPGQIAELPADQADEIISAGDGCIPGNEPKAKE